MQIWIVEIAEPLPAIDGTVRDLRCGMLAKMLSAKGHDVLWWTSTFCHHKKAHRFNESRSIDIQPGLCLRLLHGPGYRRNVSLQRIKHNRVVADAFAKEAELHSTAPDLIFACVPALEVCEKAVEDAQRRGIPIIVDARDQWPDHYLTVFPLPARRWAKWLLRSEFRRARRIFQRATGITAMANPMLEWGLGYACRPKRSTDGVFPIGYSAPGYSPGEIEEKASDLKSSHAIRTDNLVFTYIGQFGSACDLRTVIQSAKLLEQSGSANIQIVLAGSGYYESKLRKMARGLQNVVFTGWLNELEMVGLLSLSDVGLVTHAKRASYFMGNKPFQYMAAGLPLISSTRGDLEALIRDEKIGLSYKAENSSSLLEAIRWFITHEEESKAMGKRSRQLIDERFSVEIVYHELIEHMQGIVSSSRKRYEP